MIWLNAAFRADLEWWHVFASLWNGVSLMWEAGLQAPSVEIWSDASGGWGYGAWWGCLVGAPLVSSEVV